ncbi:low molecular weight phosphatase family protein [Gordonia sp. JH63]|uniref:Low molecular weight phosphatase family protein n=1 Tax=Gordonia hongkongensis TaxID=1701090 RepID=A0AAX3TBU1_9ACTN|nr:MULTISPECIES: low molecular weight phosphatase family protein [Gordonia]QIK48442.1 low molecular weight phosphatase family protein [Gordonia terrae]MBR7192048.1 low molecular weight phosphatase family protein [Gordonia sp. SCSIO 19800]QHD85603.1 low molecular weight phosphatase family protein [Gordonia sp. JH63]UPG70054.1 low molecular weight phosphatase family protein [Gordonia hongkongensis]WFP26685.1 low molecular weight phosphatase family protein [Gordonia hongkongensis]
MNTPPQVLFVCVSNRGKSVMAEYLTPTVTHEIAASSAGTSAKIGGQVNELSAQVLAEVGADVAGHQPRQLTDELMQAADLVVVVGTAEVTPPPGVVLEVWDTDEPSQRGIDGVERMRLIRDDITHRIRALADRLTR